MITSAIYFCIKLGLLQLYPTYISYKAIKVNDQKEFQSLLTFWIVAITYLSIEYFSDIFLFWIPFYTEIKLILVLWLILPQTQGAFVFYTHYLDPFLQHHEQDIDKTLVNVQEKIKETIVLYGKRLIEFLKKSISDTLFKGNETVVEEQQATPPETTKGTGEYLISPYNLFSSLVTATANRIQQQQQVEVKEDKQPSPTAEKMNRSDSQESLQSYVNIKETTSPVLPSRSSSSSTNTWSGYLSSWVVRKPSSTTVIADNQQDKEKNE